MKKDIILAGVGGQGILSIASIIGMAAIDDGLYLKQSEVHGMSQRGGDVVSNLRISDREIASDLIPEGRADMVISIEPMESLRYIPLLSPAGWLITNSSPHKNINNYPDLGEIFSEIKKVKNHLIIDADNIATRLGSGRMANTVILGAALSHLGIDVNKIEQAIVKIFKRKGNDIVDLNLKALKEGYNFGILNKDSF